MMSTRILRQAKTSNVKNPAQRLRVLALYKELHRLGRDYPDPAYNFHGKLRGLFEKNKGLTDEAEIEKAIKLGEYIRNETLALYSLRKYRHLKRMYPADSLSEPSFEKHDPNADHSPSPSSPPPSSSRPPAANASSASIPAGGEAMT